MLADGLRKACIGGRISSLVEDDIVKDEARLVLRQTIQERNVEGAVPSIVERLVELPGGIFVEINKRNLVSVKRRAPKERQVIAKPHQRFPERILPAGQP